MTINPIKSLKYILSMHLETLVGIYIITQSIITQHFMKYEYSFKTNSVFSSLISKLGFKIQAMTSIGTFYHKNHWGVHDEGAVSQQSEHTMFKPHLFWSLLFRRFTYFNQCLPYYELVLIINYQVSIFSSTLRAFYNKNGSFE